MSSCLINQSTLQSSACESLSCHSDCLPPCFVFLCSEKQRGRRNVSSYVLYFCFAKKFNDFSHPSSPAAPVRGKKEGRKENIRTAEVGKKCECLKHVLIPLTCQERRITISNSFPSQNHRIWFLLQSQPVGGRGDINWLKAERGTPRATAAGDRAVSERSERFPFSANWEL